MQSQLPLSLLMSSSGRSLRRALCTRRRRRQRALPWAGSGPRGAERVHGEGPEPSAGMHLSRWLCGFPYCQGGTAVIYCPEQSSGRRCNRRALAVPGEERRCVRMLCGSVGSVCSQCWDVGRQRWAVLGGEATWSLQTAEIRDS